MTNGFEQIILNVMSFSATKKMLDGYLKELISLADSGDVAAMGYLAYDYSVEDDLPKAEEYWNKALKKDILNLGKNDKHISYVLGLIYSNGFLVDESIADMKTWFDNSIKLGCQLPNIELGYYHYQLAMEGEEKNFDKEFDKAIECFLAAGKGGLVQGYLSLGQICLDEEDYDKAEEYFKKALPHSDANLGLGLIHFGDENFVKAEEYFLKSYESKNPAAMFHLGSIAYDVKKDIPMALKYFKESSDLGYVDAMFNLGLLYYDDENIRPDKKKAFAYFKEAADLGDPGAQFYTGVMFYEADGTAKDVKKAKYYLNLAAEAGDEEAQEFLSEI